LLTMDILGEGRLTTKFQTTIPKRARKLLKLDTHDLVVFVRENGQVVLKKGEIRVK
jgi:bifunctional DNA-binding transcriptional regulator/antitoxin component of YhaV-PrlF toxin-antitoxin module